MTTLASQRVVANKNDTEWRVILVTICMNGMHSASKIKENYPDMREDVMRQIRVFATYVRSIFGGGHPVPDLYWDIQVKEAGPWS